MDLEVIQKFHGRVAHSFPVSCSSPRPRKNVSCSRLISSTVSAALVVVPFMPDLEFFLTFYPAFPELWTSPRSTIFPKWRPCWSAILVNSCKRVTRSRLWRCFAWPGRPLTPLCFWRNSQRMPVCFRFFSIGSPLNHDSLGGDQTSTPCSSSLAA